MTVKCHIVSVGGKMTLLILCNSILLYVVGYVDLAKKHIWAWPGPFKSFSKRVK